ncbi:MAG: 16S rRNA (guanine(966)-N(2))-methyltransferase RsmD [Alphaproteobacteria bacterium]|nr:16S rRNA (guanine(966)-N(2))-methyltransferase RsmD [Alphaproteobacteria bacterium]
MRVVGGRLKGRKLAAPEGRELRPTSDRARQAVFNIIEHSELMTRPLEGATVLDAFAGTGAIGIEALSRGAAHATFIERESRALVTLASNLRACGLGPALAEILRADALNPPKARASVDLAFLDPPYREDLAPPALAALQSHGWLGDETLIVLELGARDVFDPPPGFEVRDERLYGAARVVFLRLKKKN